MDKIEELAEYARSLKLSGKFNCCQSVLNALKDYTNLDNEALNNIGSGFLAGMGNMEATCGALIGANIALGLMKDGKGTIKYSKALIEEFENECGATKCKDLKAITNGKPLCPCDLCVRNAVLAFGKVNDLE